MIWIYHAEDSNLKQLIKNVFGHFLVASANSVSVGWVSILFFTFYLIQSSPTEEIEHADILELNTIIDSLKTEKEEVEREKVCVYWQNYTLIPVSSCFWTEVRYISISKN